MPTIPQIPSTTGAGIPTPPLPQTPTSPNIGINTVPNPNATTPVNLTDSLVSAFTDPSVLGGLAGLFAGSQNQVDAPTLLEPSRIARPPIEQDILAVTDPRLQRQVDLQAQERAAVRGATGGTTSGEIFRDQLQRQLGAESISQNALNAMLSSFNLQGQQQGLENAFANQVNAARLGQLTATTSTQDRNLANIFGGATAGAQFGSIFA
jgi:hypothetical protein